MILMPIMCLTLVGDMPPKCNPKTPLSSWISQDPPERVQEYLWLHVAACRHRAQNDWESPRRTRSVKGLVVGRGIAEEKFIGLEVIIFRGGKVGWVRVMT